MKGEKLELTWIGKNNNRRIEPRVLIENKKKSYGEENTENMLIHGDNLLALKALEDKFTGKIKCIFIDPPYNTGSAFKKYDDNQEHSIWLNLMKMRLEIMRNLLSEDGSIYISIDFNEVHYLKILMDEVFGRDCFQREIIWRMGWLSGYKTMAKNYIRNHDTILFYTKSPNNYFFNKEKAYNKIEDYQERFNDESKKKIKKELKEKFNVKDENNIKEFIEFISKVGLPERYPLEDTWNSSIYDKLNSINVVSFAGEKVSKLLGVEEVKGQKSESLIKRILDISTEEGDWVLDSFLGSGTTAAVAHKMNRRWIGIELGDQCYTHCKPRLDMIVDGNENVGVTKAVNWQGGGGYKFYELAPSLLVKDKFGNWIISEEYNGELLTKAICKQEKFTYHPEECYWKQGKSSENDYIFVTTNYVSLEYLRSIEEEMKDDESLLICCKSYQEECETANDRITVKKIPQTILKNCEYGVDDYSLNVKEVLNMGEIEDEE